MRIITKNGWFAPGCVSIDRLEPWTTPQEIDDGYLAEMPSKMIIVEPPAGYRFKDGITAEDFPTKVDIEPIADLPDAPTETGESTKDKLARLANGG